jgi:hypothetical protein
MKVTVISPYRAPLSRRSEGGAGGGEIFLYSPSALRIIPPSMK